MTRTSDADVERAPGAQPWELASHALTTLRERVYFLTAQIPAGQVATYGQLAFLAGHPGAARAVGTCLRECLTHHAEPIPWQRVINAQGRVSLRGDVARAELQRRLLRAEGVPMDDQGRCRLQDVEWTPDSSYWAIDWPLDPFADACADASDDASREAP